MICVQILTRRREQTLTRFTNAMLHLLFAGWMPEICCRTANIMNISFKVLIFCNFFCFFNQRFMTSYLDNSSLMERQCAKTASSKTSSVADQTEFNLLDCRNSAFCLVRRMVSPLIRKRVNIIHLHLCQWCCRWILYYIQMFRIRFYKTFSVKCIRIQILCVKAAGIIHLVRFEVFKGRKDFRIINTV